MGNKCVAARGRNTARFNHKSFQQIFFCCLAVSQSTLTLKAANCKKKGDTSSHHITHHENVTPNLPLTCTDGSIGRSNDSPVCCDSSGRRLDGVGKVVRLRDGVHTLAQSRVPSPPTYKWRKALQWQHDGEQELHRGAVCKK